MIFNDKVWCHDSSSWHPFLNVVRLNLCFQCVACRVSDGVEKLYMFNRFNLPTKLPGQIQRFNSFHGLLSTSTKLGEKRICDLRETYGIEHKRLVALVSAKLLRVVIKDLSDVFPLENPCLYPVSSIDNVPVLSGNILMENCCFLSGVETCSKMVPLAFPGPGAVCTPTSRCLEWVVVKETPISHCFDDITHAVIAFNCMWCTHFLHSRLKIG